jgi:SAM-dependent methyltransferase
MTSIWHRLVAALYDRLLAAFEENWLQRKRCELLASCRGDVLEVGGGTGANLSCYPASTRLVFTEPDPAMLARCAPKLPKAPLWTSLALARAEELPFLSNSFDTVVATLTLCSVQDPHVSLTEIARVLRPEGRLLFLEHGRAEGKLGRWQDRLTPLWSAVALGCHLNRLTVISVQSAGFRLERLERHHPPGMPRIIQPAYCGVAVKEKKSIVRAGLASQFDSIGVQGGSR